MFVNKEIDNRGNIPYNNGENRLIVQLYQMPDGTVPIVEFIEQIEDIKIKNKVLRSISMLEEFGRFLYEPYVKY